MDGRPVLYNPRTDKKAIVVGTILISYIDDTGAAIAMARNYSGPSMSKVLTSSLLSEVPSGFNTPSPYLITDSADEFVDTFVFEVGLNLNNSTSHLMIKVTSPSETESILLNPYNAYSTTDLGIYDSDNVAYPQVFISNAFYGKNANGQWKFELVDFTNDTPRHITGDEIDYFRACLSLFDQ